MKAAKVVFGIVLCLEGCLLNCTLALLTSSYNNNSVLILIDKSYIYIYIYIINTRLEDLSLILVLELMRQARLPFV